MFRLIAITFAAALVASSAFGQSMEVMKNSGRDGFIGPSDKFTGTAYIEIVFSNKDPFVVDGGKVTFLPGARSNWHTHPAGQVLIVTEGTGWVQEEGQDKHVMQPGDVVWCPPGVKHWHGATDTTAVTHIAIQQYADGENVIWMEPVTDEQYAGDSESCMSPTGWVPTRRPPSPSSRARRCWSSWSSPFR
jgi:quercetin dioxygenase-like cupin family protein